MKCAFEESCDAIQTRRRQALRNKGQQRSLVFYSKAQTSSDCFGIGRLYLVVNQPCDHTGKEREKYACTHHPSGFSEKVIFQILLSVIERLESWLA